MKCGRNKHKLRHPQRWFKRSDAWLHGMNPICAVLVETKGGYWCASKFEFPCQDSDMCDPHVRFWLKQKAAIGVLQSLNFCAKTPICAILMKSR